MFRTERGDKRTVLLFASEDCDDCEDCKDCDDCEDCKDCEDCNECEDCKDCKDCKDCEDCEECNNSDDCVSDAYEYRLTAPYIEFDGLRYVVRTSSEPAS